VQIGDGAEGTIGVEKGRSGDIKARTGYSKVIVQCTTGGQLVGNAGVGRIEWRAIGVGGCAARAARD
jgi:hypothetical protein